MITPTCGNSHRLDDLLDEYIEDADKPGLSKPKSRLCSC